MATFFPELLCLFVFLAPQPAPPSPSRATISLTKFPFRLDPLLCQAAPGSADGNLRFQGGRQAGLHMPRINPFAQRLTDLLEACVDLLVFGLRGLPPPCLAPPLLALPGPLLDALEHCRDRGVLRLAEGIFFFEVHERAYISVAERLDA